MNDFADCYCVEGKRGRYIYRAYCIGTVRAQVDYGIDQFAGGMLAGTYSRHKLGEKM